MEFIQDYGDLEQTRKNIEENLELFTDGGGANFRKNDIQNYMNYYGYYDRSKYDYIRKFEDRELPALPRKINLQQNAVNVLLSERALRPIPGAPRVYDKKISIERYDNIIKQKINILMNAHRAKYYKYTADIQSIQMKMQEIEGQVNREPQSQEDAERISQLKMNFPYIKNQFFQIMDSLEDQQLLSKEEVEKHERFFKYDYKDYYQRIGEKIKKKIIDELKFKNIEKRAFKSKMITGKPIYLVLSEKNKKNVTIRHLNENTVFWPKFSGIKWIQKGPWAGYSEIISFNSMMLHYGKQIKDKYGQKAINELKSVNNRNDGKETLMVSTPDNGAYFIDQIVNNTQPTVQEMYSGSFQTTHGIEKKIIYYKANRRVYIKVSPNKYDKEKPFEHFINPFKRLINKDEYRYDPKEKVYIHKKDKSRFIKKENAEVYSKKKGEDYIVKYITDIYKGVILNDSYIVDEELHDRIVENPDDFGDVNLPIFGPAFSDETDQPTSPISMTNDLQDLYDTLSLHREIAIAISGAAGVVIDRSQKPDMEDDEWEYHMKMGRLYIQTADSEGRPTSTFNQWKTYDNSLGQGVMYIDQIMNGIQQLMGLIIGVPRQRIGELTKTDQVGTYDASLKQASLITQILHFDQDELNSLVLEEAINLYIKYHLEFDEGILDISNFDMGFEQSAVDVDALKKFYFKVYLDSNASDSQDMEKIKEFSMQSALSGKGMLDMGDVAKLFNKDSLRDMMDAYDNIVSKKREAAQQAQSQENQNEFQNEQKLKELEGQMKIQVEQIKNEIESKKLKFDEFKHKSEQELENRKLAIESKLKLLELVNEQKSEEEVLMNNDKHATTEEQIRLLEMRINALLGKDKQDKDFQASLDKNDKNYKAKKLVKEHVSDK
ncbi:MAG: hypothetical protein K9M80_01850 [Candidatus Marinimicrobia bacterium]|nr:hypothetical protein [Candidatus Neomarinimicrobiota bacterium]